MFASDNFKSAALALSLVIASCSGLDQAAQARTSKNLPSASADVVKKGGQSDESDVRSQLAEMERRIVAGDAANLAALWAVDGEYVDEDGNKSSGRKAIQDRFAAVFSQNGKQQLHLISDSIKFLAPTVALVEGVVQIDRGGQAMPDTNFSLVLTKSGGGWLLSRASESPAAKTSNYAYLRQFDWLIGEWNASGANATVHLKAEWVPSKNFIVCKYETKKSDGAVSIDMQVIGWDPVLNQPRSWHFDSTGGFGQGLWSKANGQWICEASGVEANGSTTRSRNIMSVKGANTFDWSSVNRSVDGMAVGDAAPLSVQRLAN